MAVMAEAGLYDSSQPQRVEQVKGERVHEANRSPFKPLALNTLMTYAAVHLTILYSHDNLSPPRLSAVIWYRIHPHRSTRRPDTTPRQLRSPARYRVVGRASTPPEQAR